MALTLAEMARTPLTHDEMYEIGQEEELREANWCKVIVILDALLEDDAITEQDYYDLEEHLEELEPMDIAVMAEDSTILHKWIDEVVTFLNPEPCRFGTRCTRPDCYYDHPEGRAIDTPCRDDVVCTSQDCYFKHPNGRNIDTAPTQARPVVCELGYYCRDRECANSHKSREIDKKCNAGKGCTRRGCWFDHN